MNIYHLKRNPARPYREGWDPAFTRGCTSELVIVAGSERLARLIANKIGECIFEKDIWLREADTVCKLIGQAASDVKVGLICHDYNEE